ncbi:hypothetical protein RB195_022811 [Necator americanus]|uniref:CCHC-type domain-containing protein n=1 Tax=Necator americanus TaxID=51031 RepID=A0ABR1EJ98_NECAM
MAGPFLFSFPFESGRPLTDLEYAEDVVIFEESSTKLVKLCPDVRYYVKLNNPLMFKQAVVKTQMVDQLLVKATADRLINPPCAARAIEVMAVTAEPLQTDYGECSIASCYNCGGIGRLARKCPSFRVPSPDAVNVVHPDSDSLLLLLLAYVLTAIRLNSSMASSGSPRSRGLFRDVAGHMNT